MPALRCNACEIDLADSLPRQETSNGNPDGVAWVELARYSNVSESLSQASVPRGWPSLPARLEEHL